MVDWLPLHQDAAVTGRAGVELRRRKDWGPTERGRERNNNGKRSDRQLHCDQEERLNPKLRDLILRYMFIL